MNKPLKLLVPPIAEPIAGHDFAERQRWRFGLLSALLISLACLVVVRLISVQIFPAQSQQPFAPQERQMEPRGAIVDRNGELLAGDRFFYRIIAAPKYLESDVQRMEAARKLNEMLSLPVEKTLGMLTKYSDSEWLKLAEDIPLQQGQKLLDLKKQHADDSDEDFPLRYVWAEPIPRRYYPQERLASHLIGFVNLTRDSLYGVERYYDRYLRTEVNIKPISGAPVQSNSQRLAPETLRFLPSVSGNDLVLTIDRGVQWIIEDELDKGMKRYRAKAGTIIVMNPKNGAILGMASWPDYDPNRYSDESVERFLDPAISQLYEPGSIFKVITMAAGLDTGVITPTMMVQDLGAVVVGRREIKNSDKRAHGEVSVTQALAQSLNVITAQIAQMIGPDQFYQYVRRFGFAVATEVDIAGEVPGMVKFPGNENWSVSDLGTNSFGQGLAVTPLQMTNAVAAIANGGKLMRPYVVQARLQNGQVIETQPTVVRSVMERRYADELTDMMVETVQISNLAAAVPGYSIAGKSGTAQIPSPEGYLEDEIIGSFVGFAPADDPQFVLLVKVERPDFKLTQWADQNAAPLFGQVARRLFLHLNIAPDEIRLAQR